jgi:hypothetical protein
LNTHYCQEHQTKFFRNEKIDSNNGQSNVWYSHKIKDGSGFCVEKGLEKYEQPALLEIDAKPVSNTSKAMFACNAMNNAVNLAANGRIEVEEIGQEFKKLLTVLQTI